MGGRGGGAARSNSGWHGSCLAHEAGREPSWWELCNTDASAAKAGSAALVPAGCSRCLKRWR